MNNNKKKNKPKDRFKILIIIMCIVFIGIISRLVYLQVINYTNYKERANKRAIRFMPTTAPRGKILDSNGNILATNKQTYTLNFTETDESKKKFYDTVDRVHKMLTETGESMQDKFQLRLDGNNNFYFDFKVQSPEEKRALELRFKKDRGLDEKIKADLQKKGEIPKGDEELSVENEEKIDEKLLKITPEETFKYLVKEYNAYYALKEFRDSKDYTKDPALKAKAKEYLKASDDEIFNLLLKEYNVEELRRYIAVKDAVKMQSFSGFKPVNIASNIGEKTAFEFYQKLNDLPGVNVALDPVRYYPYGELGASVMGYVSAINGSSKNKYEEKGYDISTDVIGRAGIEAAFESALRGEKGGETVKVNADGRKTSELFQLETYPGKNVSLTIDRDIQYSAEHMLKDQLTWLQGSWREGANTTMATRGAVVAIEVDTGRILALASYPSFDPNMFTQGQLNTELTKKYFNPDLEAFGKEFIAKHNLSQTVDDLFPKNKEGQRDDKYDIYPKPFYNYATLGLIPPGSTFKPMTAVAALEEGVDTPESTIYVPKGRDYFTDYPEIFGNTPPADRNCDGTIDVKKALQHSSNSYFYDAAVKLFKKYNAEGKPIEGLDTIYKYAWKFGLGLDPDKKQKAATGIEIAENFGSVYNFERFKKNKIYYSKWTLVSSLEGGCFDKSNATFPSVDIAHNENDSEELAATKEKLKKLTTDELELVGRTDIIKDKDNIKKNVVEILNEIYNNSDKYRKSIEASGKSKDVAILATANAITNWMAYSMPFEITSPAQLAYAAIGQGIDAFSPVQIVNYIATLANGGTRYKAHLVDKVTDADGNVIEDFKPEVIDKINISKSTLDAIKEGMRRCNNEDGGSGFRVFGNFPITTCGKTGTATFSRNQDEVGRQDFGVYISFAPIDKPKIAVVTAIYDGGHGYFGEPIVKAIYETYFRNELKKDFPSYTAVNPLSGEKYDYSLNPPLENKQSEEKK